MLDSNVFVAAGFKPRSHSARILAAIDRGELRLVWNDAVRREVLHTVRRIPPLRDQAPERFFRPEGLYTGPLEPHRFTHITDPADREFAALAVAAGTAVVSSDHHLLDHRHRAHPPIHTPGDFLRLLEASQPQQSSRE